MSGQVISPNLPCPVFLARLLPCASCAVAPNKPSPAASAPADSLSTTGDLRERKREAQDRRR